MSMMVLGCVHCCVILYLFYAEFGFSCMLSPLSLQWRVGLQALVLSEVCGCWSRSWQFHPWLDTFADSLVGFFKGLMSFNFP